VSRNGTAGAVNSEIIPTVEYGPDPHGWSMFTSLAGIVQRGVAGRNGGRVLNSQAAFNGYGQSVQKFSGMAPLGHGIPLTRMTATLADARAASPLDDTALRIFAQRLTRGKA
jgi:hypothetical protein